MQDMKEFVIGVAGQAGEVAVSKLSNLEISSKGEKNIVTNADKAVEKFIIQKIKERFPDHNIIAEESENKSTGSGHTWYIDPIDGTSNYAHGDPNFCVSIALSTNGKLEYGCINIPMLKEVYFAQSGKGAELNGKRINVSKVMDFKKAFVQVGISPLMNAIDDSLRVYKYFTLQGERARDYGFCAGQLAYLAAGRADAFVKLGQKPWDIAAGIIMVSEAGGKVTDLDGNKITLAGKNLKHNIIASNGSLHQEMIVHFKKIGRNFRSENADWY